MNLPALVEYSFPNSPMCRTLPTRSAFTLVEILVTISIIATLAALLFPAIEQVKTAGSRSKCIANLKQMGIAIQLYANDNNGELPYAKTAGSRKVWTDLIASYAGSTEGNWRTPIGVMECPMAGKDGRQITWGRGYAMNDNPGFPDIVPESWKRNWEESWCARAGESSPRRFKLAEISHPTKRFLIGDGLTWDIGVDDLPANFSEDAMRSNNFAAIDRHGKGRSNVLFFDGHAASVTPEQLYLSIKDPANFQ